MPYDDHLARRIVDRLEGRPDAVVVSRGGIVEGQLGRHRIVPVLLQTGNQRIPAGRFEPGAVDQAEGRQGLRHGLPRPGLGLISTLPRMATVLSVVEVIMSVILIFLVLLHSGKDAGLSGAFGIGGGGSSFGGGSLVERNLTRWTIFFGILWALNAIVILKL